MNTTSNTRWSYSRVSTYQHCPKQYQLRYLDRLTTIPDQDPQNALYLGTAIHTGLEKDVDAALESYASNYYMLTTDHYHEMIKLEELIPKCKAILPKGEHEVKIEANGYIGYIDLLADDWIIDYKYSNNWDNYLNSPQIHLYKFFADRPINRLSYLFIPKIRIRQSKYETVQDFRIRLYNELKYAEPKLVDVPYNEDKVKEWLQGVKDAENATEFPKNETRLCRWCEFYDACLKGETWMLYQKEGGRK